MNYTCPDTDECIDPRAWDWLQGSAAMSGAKLPNVDGRGAAAKNFFPKPPAGSVSWRDKINEIGALLKQLWPQWQRRHTQQSIRLTGEPMDSADRGSQRQQSRHLGRLTDSLTRAQSCHWLPSPISATKFVPPCDDSAHMDILRSAAAKRPIGIK